MAKIIVTHRHVDLDALCSVWLIKRFLPSWSEAKIDFVPVGQTLRGAPPDDDLDILHVDVGGGKLDHHRFYGEYSSAAHLVLEKIFNEREFSKFAKEALKRLVEVVTEVDNGRMITWENASSDRYEFCLHQFLPKLSEKDEEIVHLGLNCLDAVFRSLREKIAAEEAVEKEGRVFGTRWGKAVAVETAVDEVLSVGQKKGYVLVAKKDPRSGHLRIYGRWDKELDLTRAYEELKKKDPLATWYLHPSKRLLLNGSRTSPGIVPTKLSLSEIIKILKNA